MDSFIVIIIFFLVLSLLERVLKSGKKGKRLPPSEQGDEEAAEAAPGTPQSLEELIAEQLGINLERRPRVQAPEPAAPGASLETSPTPPASPAPADRLVVHPREGRRPGRGMSSAERGATAARRRRGQVARRGRPREPEPELSLEERGMLERGEAVSLETPRRPEDHERYQERYGVPQPVATHEEFHDRYVGPAGAVRRARRGPRFPDRPNWSPTQRAIVWAEVLGRPRGLSE